MSNFHDRIRIRYFHGDAKVVARLHQFSRLKGHFHKVTKWTWVVFLVELEQIFLIPMFCPAHHHKFRIVIVLNNCAHRNELRGVAQFAFVPQNGNDLPPHRSWQYSGDNRYRLFLPDEWGYLSTGFLQMRIIEICPTISEEMSPIEFGLMGSLDGHENDI